MRTGTALLAVAVLCLAAVGLFCADDVSAADEPPSLIDEVGYGNAVGNLGSDKKMTITVTANNGYVVPQTSKFTVTEDSVSKTVSDYQVSEDRRTATFVVKNVEAPVTISGTCVQVFEGKMECVLGADKTENKDLPPVYFKEEYVAEVPVLPGYESPKQVKVYIGAAKTPLSQATYADGKVKVPAVHVTGSVRVVGDYTAQEYTVTGNITNGTLEVPAEKPVYGQKYSVTIRPAENYACPPASGLMLDIGTLDYTYDQTTGVLTINKVTKAITVTAVCPPQVFSIVYHDGDKVIQAEPSEYTYGVGGDLPKDCPKKGYVFDGWMDADGNPVDSISKDSVGDVHVYAKYSDDMSSYDIGSYQAPTFVLALVGLIGLIAVAVAAKVRL